MELVSRYTKARCGDLVLLAAIAHDRAQVRVDTEITKQERLTGRRQPRGDQHQVPTDPSEFVQERKGQADTVDPRAEMVVAATAKKRFEALPVRAAHAPGDRSRQRHRPGLWVLVVQHVRSEDARQLDVVLPRALIGIRLPRQLRAARLPGVARHDDERAISAQALTHPVRRDAGGRPGVSQARAAAWIERQLTVD